MPRGNAPDSESYMDRAVNEANEWRERALAAEKLAGKHFDALTTLNTQYDELNLKHVRLQAKLALAVEALEYAKSTSIIAHHNGVHCDCQVCRTLTQLKGQP